MLAPIAAANGLHRWVFNKNQDESGLSWDRKEPFGELAAA